MAGREGKARVRTLISGRSKNCKMTLRKYSKLSASSPVPTPPLLVVVDSVGDFMLDVGVAWGDEDDERSGEVGRPAVDWLKEEK